MQTTKLTLGILLCLVFSSFLHASKLIEVKVVDKDHILCFFKDGEVIFTDNAQGKCAYTNCAEVDDNELITYGTALDTIKATDIANWVITSVDDENYSAGKSPAKVYRKSKLTGMSQEEWTRSGYSYEWAYEHSIYLKLPASLEQGKTYTVSINANTNSDETSKNIAFDIFSSRSEAVKVNLVGYFTSGSVKAVDLYMWLGDGGARDYSSFEGNKVYIYNVDNKTSQEVGLVEFWQKNTGETVHKRELIRSDVWKADITNFNTPGTYRVAIEGVGCSEDFEIDEEIYRDPYQVSVLGFYYMRIGEDGAGMTPVPRKPLYIPGVSPANCKVYLTTMHPYHPEWETFSEGPWDREQDWEPYIKPGKPTNPNAYGGHSDALDWDRHLGHVSIIYDMLLPYFITNGGLSDDDLGIPESGNGIPDLLDEARNEVDFWLRLRDGKGYGHGITNPDRQNVLYQSAPTAVAAWASAANAAMLANCFQLAGLTDLMEEYRDSAIVAYNYAGGLSDQMLEETQSVGNSVMSGADFKMTAAAYLYNITGNTVYEDAVKEESRVNNAWSVFNNVGKGATFDQTYALAAYLFTSQKVNYPALYDNMRASVIYQAKRKEARYSLSRPSRRGSDYYIGWFITEIGVQRTIIAHALSDDGADKDLFFNALVLEADWSLGRNPLNMIQMTTATTALAHKKSVENAYTSGWNDGTPGVHPGHTPSMNVYDWGGSIMGRPSWMTEKNYPDVSKWPTGELSYNTRYVYAHCEFTPQQNMRGKQALYGYLYADKKTRNTCNKPKLGGDTTICADTIILNARVTDEGTAYLWKKEGVILAGENAVEYGVKEPGKYIVTVIAPGCGSATDTIVIAPGVPDVDLGDDKTLGSKPLVLNAGITGEGVNYVWKKNGKVLREENAVTYQVTKEGTYSVTVSGAGCVATTDEINIFPKIELNISGRVANINDEAIQGLTVQLSGKSSEKILTDEDGRYSFKVDKGGDYRLKLFEAGNAEVINGVSTVDIALLNRHVLVESPLANPYKIIAGDVNFSNNVSTVDCKQIRDVILESETDFFGRSWVFVPATHVFSDVQNPFPYPEIWETESLEKDVSVDFTAVKLGDINGSLELKSLNEEALRLDVTDYKIENDRVTVFVKSHGFSDLSSFQFTMEWDTDILEYRSIAGEGLEMTCNERRTADGILTALWYEHSGGTTSFDPGDILFNLVFDVKAKLDEVLPIGLTSSVTKSIAYDSELRAVGVKLKSGGETYGIRPLGSKEMVGNNKNISVYPNPFSEHLAAEFNLKYSETIELSLTDISGRLIKSRIIKGSPGKNNTEWLGLANVKEGRYVLRIRGNSVNYVVQVNCIK